MTKTRIYLIALFTVCLGYSASSRAQYTDLADFNGTDGANPIFDEGLALSPDGSTLFGTTLSGGANNDGVVFSVPVGGGTPTVLTSFNGADGLSPQGAVTLIGGTLYGVTDNNSNSGFGSGEVFSLPVGGGTPTVLAGFNGTNGSSPRGLLIVSGNTLYGTTAGGGANGDGEVFSVPKSGGTPTILASFSGTNGSLPYGGLILSGSTLYGTTEQGGANGDGEVFSVPVGGGTPTVLASFNGTNGESPLASLILRGSTLYGTTQQGGANGDGEVFSLPIGGGIPTVLTSFNFTDGDRPNAALTLSADGNTLYGTTQDGGTDDFGVVFSLPVGGGTPTLLAEGSDGNGQKSALTLSADGSTLYGTAQDGTGSGGDVYSVPTGVPEPATVGLLVLGISAALSGRRRRL